MKRLLLVFLLTLMGCNAFFFPSPPRCSTRLFGLVDQVNDEIKQAMKDKEKDKLTALRNIKGAFLIALKEEGTDSLPDEKAVNILRKLQKQRLESIEMFVKGGRDDMVQAEQAELKIVESYLPQLANEETTRKWVEEALKETGAASPKDMGKVMGFMNKTHKNIDNKLVQKIATELLKQ